MKPFYICLVIFATFSICQHFVSGNEDQDLFDSADSLGNSVFVKKKVYKSPQRGCTEMVPSFDS